MTWDVLRYDTVDSTNNVCKALAAQGLDSTAVIARAQTAGKGRLGRSFQSPEGGLYLSALWQDCPAGVAGGRDRCQCGTGHFSAGHRGHGHIPCPTRA